MQVSFIVPLFNRLDLTQAMLASLTPSLPSSLTYEIILVDDGSTDGTRAWAATLPAPVRVVLNESNLGYAGANNRAAATARGELLVLINNDLVLAPGWLEPMLQVHATLGARAGVVGNIQRRFATGEIDHVGIDFDLKGKPTHDLITGSGLLKSTPAVTGACILVSAALWREVGGFDEAFVNGCEDVDLCLRAARLGRINAVALESTVEHHISSSPGRKRRDEANTCRLLLHWRAEIVYHASRAWFRDYARRGARDPRDFNDDWLAWTSLAFRLGLSSRPPPEAIAAIQQAIDVEFARWRVLGVLAEVSASEESPAQRTAAAG